MMSRDRSPRGLGGVAGITITGCRAGGGGCGAAIAAVTGTMPCSFFRFLSFSSTDAPSLTELADASLIVDCRLFGLAALVGLDVMTTF